jgi:hypothetical protein
MKKRPLQNVEAGCASPLPGGANQFPGQESHPLKTSAFSRRTCYINYLGCSVLCVYL